MRLAPKRPGRAFVVRKSPPNLISNLISFARCAPGLVVIAAVAVLWITLRRINLLLPLQDHNALSPGSEIINGNIALSASAASSRPLLRHAQNDEHSAVDGTQRQSDGTDRQQRTGSALDSYQSGDIVRSGAAAAALATPVGTNNPDLNTIGRDSAIAGVDAGTSNGGGGVAFGSWLSRFVTSSMQSLSAVSTAREVSAAQPLPIDAPSRGAPSRQRHATVDVSAWPDPFNTSRLVDLLRHRAWRQDDPAALDRGLRASPADWELAKMKSPGNQAASITDFAVNVKDDDDPDQGLEMIPPRAEWIHPSLHDRARVQHAADAEIAIVIPSSPRILQRYPETSGILPGWWMTRGDCGQTFTYRQIFRPDDQSLREDQWLRRLADECVAEPRCLGFDHQGRLHDHVDQFGCSIVASSANPPASEKPTLNSAMFWKRPPTIAVLPRRVDISEWPMHLETLERIVDADWLKSSASREATQDAPDVSDAEEVAAEDWNEQQHVIEDVRPGAQRASNDAPVSSWWVLERADIVGKDLRQVDRTAGGRLADSKSQLAYVRSACAQEPTCLGFTWPGAWLKSSVDVMDIAAGGPQIETGIWSRVPLVSPDYLIMTVVSLAREMEAESPGTCGFPSLTPYDMMHDAAHPPPRTGSRLGPEALLQSVSPLAPDAAVTYPSTVRFDDASLNGRQVVMNESLLPPWIVEDQIAGPTGSRAASAATAKRKESVMASFPIMERLRQHPYPAGVDSAKSQAANGHILLLGAPSDHPPIRSLRTHVYVMDTSGLDMHSTYLDERPGAVPRSPLDDEYFLSSFAWLRSKFGHSPCISFVPATSFTRLRETATPLRGHPDHHPENAGKQMVRKTETINQLLDFVSAMRFAAARSPAAHLLTWEDDCFACPATVSAYSRAAAVLDVAEPQWAVIKVGNGGSGILFNQDVVSRAIWYLQTRRGSDNVDVSMWRFAFSGGWPDFLSFRTRSAHRGTTSSFRMQMGSTWARVRCGGELDNYWGQYRYCNGVELLHRLRAAAGSDAGDGGDLQRSALIDVAEVVSRTFMHDWKCGIHSAMTSPPSGDPRDNGMSIPPQHGPDTNANFITTALDPGPPGVNRPTR